MELSPITSMLTSSKCVRRCLSVLGMCEAVLMFSVVSAYSAEPAVDQVTNSWRSSQRCGANCVYIMLRLNGCSPEYHKILNILAPGRKGSSIGQMAGVARQHGMPTALVYKATPKFLESASLPVILHLEPGNAETGHYIVLTAFSEKEVEFIDGSTCNLRRTNWEEVSRKWTGYVIAESSYGGYMVQFLVVAIAVTLVGTLVMRRRMVHSATSTVLGKSGEGLTSSAAREVDFVASRVK